MPEQTDSTPHFQKVSEAAFVRGEHDVLRFWTQRRVFERLNEKNADGQQLDEDVTGSGASNLESYDACWWCWLTRYDASRPATARPSAIGVVQ